MTNASSTAQNYLQNWQTLSTAAEQLMAYTGLAYRHANLQLTLAGQPLINQSVSQVITLAEQSSNTNLEEVTQTVRQLLVALDILDNQGSASQTQQAQYPAKSLDITTLKDTDNIAQIATTIKSTDQSSSSTDAITDVVLYGFGRIGRILTRLFASQQFNSNQLTIKAIVVRPSKDDNDLAKRASLLARDSIHGTFDGAVQLDSDNNALVVNGQMIQLIYANDPSQIDYTQYGINNALVIDNTGKWRDEEGLNLHLQAKGVSKVLLTAPAKGDIKNIVYGVNDSEIADTDTIMSAASCTTNAISPTLAMIDEQFGIKNGHIETIHAYTNDQNLIDNYHNKDRRGRAAALNMVLTETGAAKAVAKVIPKLAGCLSGNAVRVPTPNVSMAILNLNLNATADSSESLNDYIKQQTQTARWQHQLGYSDSPEAVSTDFLGAKQAGVFDAKATLVDDDRVTLYVWYDNEVGYSCQVIRVAMTMAGQQPVAITAS